MHRFKFLIIGFLFPLVSFASENQNLDSYLGQLDSQLSQIKEENLCQSSSFTSSYSDSLLSLISSFSSNFSGNDCFRRDLKKIEKLQLKISQKIQKLKSNCQDNSQALSLQSELKKKKSEFRSYSGEFFLPELYGSEQTQCEEDSFYQLKTDWQDFRQNLSKITSLDLSTLFEIDYEKTQQKAKKQAQNYLAKNLSAYTQSFGFHFEMENQIKKSDGKNTILDSISSIFLSLKNSPKTELNFSKENREFLSQLEDSQEKQNLKDFFLDSYKENSTLNLKTDETDEILLSLNQLTYYLLLVNGDEEELKKYSLEDSLSLRKFISDFIYFLDSHNTAVDLDKGIFLKKDYE